MYKKLVASSFILGTLVLGGGSVLADKEESVSFDDVTKDSFAYDSIMYLASEGIIKGYGNGKYGLKDDVTREQVAALIARYLELDADKEYDNPYSDVEGAMLEQDVLAVTDAGYMQGIGHRKFDPEGVLTRAEMAEVLTNVFDLEVKKEYDFIDVNDKHWAQDSIRALYSNGITFGTGEGKFKPEDEVTREQYAEFLYRGIHLDEDYEPEPIEPEPEDGDDDKDKEDEKDKDKNEIAGFDFYVGGKEEMTVGESSEMSLAVAYKDGNQENVTRDATFTVDKKGIIEIAESGYDNKVKTIKALSEGEVTITASYKGEEVSETVTVVAEEPPEDGESPNEVTYVDNNTVLDDIIKKGYRFTHTGWTDDSDNSNPKYISKDTGNPVEPSWEDEFGMGSDRFETLFSHYTGASSVPYHTNIGVTNFVNGEHNYDGLYRVGMNLIMSGVEMTREEYEGALGELIETGESVSFKGITMEFDKRENGVGQEVVSMSFSVK